MGREGYQGKQWMGMFYEIQRPTLRCCRESTGNVTLVWTIDRCPCPDQFQEEARMKDRRSVAKSECLA